MEPKKEHHHHILPVNVALAIGFALLILTGVTVWIAGVDLGAMNFPIALLVASIKAILVGMFFMGLKYDRHENAMIFTTSFVFLAIFISFTASDLFFRGDVEVKGPLMAAAPQTGSKVVKPWIATPALLAKGKELFSVQCVSCHGPGGHGDGPAASALNPHPRNFTSADGWTNGRKPSQVFKTLKEGVAGTGMASYATLPVDDRWALVHYVLSLGPTAPEATAADLLAVGVDVNKATSEEKVAPTIPVELAMKRMTVESVAIHQYAPVQVKSIPARPGAQLYAARCAECHANSGEGGVVTQTTGVHPIDKVVSRAFVRNASALASQASFNQVVTQGLTGNVMPANADLSGSELRELYEYVNSLAK